MTRALALAIAIAMAPMATRARADDEPAPADTADTHIAKARELHDKGDFAGARAEILVAYKLDPRPELLFALGQIEFNLHHYREAIDYYERFEATRPNADQAAVAEQAIGAARAELSQPPPAPTPVVPQTPPKPPPHREWDAIDAALAAFGGLGIAAGGALTIEAVHLSNDGGGTLSDYDQRIATARHLRIAAGVSAAAGLVAIGAAILRWRIHLVDTVEVQATPTGAGVALEHAF